MENKEINYCPKCGNKLTGNEKFCSVCGSPVLDFFSNEKEQIISESQNKIYVKKKKSIVKRILVGGGILFIALIVFGIFLPEDESNVGSENVVETEKEAEVEKKVETTKSESVSNNNFKSDVDVVETLKNRGASTTPSFTISDAQGNFINSHINLFPAEFSDFEEVSNYIDYTLDYAHMAKNPKSYIGKFAFVDGLKVIQVAEQEYNYGSSQYNYVTVMTLKDDSEHIYVVYYIGKSIELVQGDYARIIAMPIEYSSYKNLENNSVLSLVMVASVAENSDQKEITNGYFSDEPDYSGIAENTNTQDDYYILCKKCNCSKGNDMTLTKSDLKKRKSSYAQYKRSEVLKPIIDRKKKEIREKYLPQLDDKEILEALDDPRFQEGKADLRREARRKLI